MKLLQIELSEQHDYQHEHQGEQGPPTGKYVGVKDLLSEFVFVFNRHLTE